MTITIRITLPAALPGAATLPEAARLLRAAAPLAVPALLTAAEVMAEAAGLGLPGRILLRGALSAVEHGAARGA